MQKIISETKPLLASLRVNDKERKEIQQLSDQSDNVCQDLAKYFRKHKQSVEQHALAIKQATSPMELDMERLLGYLRAADADFNSGRNAVIGIITMVQALIEPCRYRIIECKQEMDKRSDELKVAKHKLHNVGEEYLQLVSDRNDANTERFQSEINADTCKIRRNVGAVVGAGTTVGAFVVGFAFAPFTAGISAGIGLAVAAPHALLHGGLAIGNHVVKGKWEELAEQQHRREIECKERMDELENEVETCKADIARLAKKIDDMKRAIQLLTSFTSKLHVTYDAVNLVRNIIEEIMNALNDTILQSRTFKMTKAGYACNPDKLGPMANRQMLAVKEKWDQLQKVTEMNAHQFICG